MPREITSGMTVSASEASATMPATSATVRGVRPKVRGDPAHQRAVAIGAVVGFGLEAVDDKAHISLLSKVTRMYGV